MSGPPGDAHADPAADDVGEATVSPPCAPAVETSDCALPETVAEDEEDEGEESDRLTLLVAVVVGEVGRLNVVGFDKVGVGGAANSRDAVVMAIDAGFSLSLSLSLSSPSSSPSSSASMALLLLLGVRSASGTNRSGLGGCCRK